MNLINLQAFLKTATGLTVQAANQSIDRPERPYASWNIISQIRQGQREMAYTTSGTDLDEQTALPYVYNVEIQFYTTTDRAENNGKLARERANDFLLYLNSTAGAEEVIQYDFKILNHSDYSNVDEYLSTEFERRAVIELQVFGYETLTTPINRIDPDTLGTDTITINMT